jgi:pyruvate/2-oxoglutarate dehydrogenase complex dihydrolipoamide dehydrogenase (E3) component
MTQTESASSAQIPQKTQPEQYDLVILGDGTGSTLAAWTFASDGKRVAVVERKFVGGSCPNIACLPSKNIIDSAKVATYFRGAERGGIAKPGSAIDMPAVLARKRRMVRGLNEMYLENFKSSGAELILGVGRFIGPGTLEVTLPDGARRQLRGANVIISTGTHAVVEPVPGIADAQPLTHVEALELDEVPEHLLVIGGGYVGLELAQAMRRFGSKVTVIDRNDRVLPREDDDVAEAVTSLFQDEGIEVLLNAAVKRISGKSGQSVKVIVEQSGAEKTLEGSHLLVATGRTPNTQGIGLELAGVKVTDSGYIKVNERLQSTAPGVWAIGEVAGRFFLHGFSWHSERQGLEMMMEGFLHSVLVVAPSINLTTTTLRLFLRLSLQVNWRPRTMPLCQSIVVSRSHSSSDRPSRVLGSRPHQESLQRRAPGGGRRRHRTASESGHQRRPRRTAGAGEASARAARNQDGGGASASADRARAHNNGKTGACEDREAARHQGRYGTAQAGARCCPDEGSLRGDHQCTSGPASQCVHHSSESGKPLEAFISVTNSPKTTSFSAERIRQKHTRKIRSLREQLQQGVVPFRRCCLRSQAPEKGAWGVNVRANTWCCEEL